jgi:hypothetical protein
MSFNICRVCPHPKCTSLHILAMSPCDAHLCRFLIVDSYVDTNCDNVYTLIRMPSSTNRDNRRCPEGNVEGASVHRVAYSSHAALLMTRGVKACWPVTLSQADSVTRMYFLSLVGRMVLYRMAMEHLSNLECVVVPCLSRDLLCDSTMACNQEWGGGPDQQFKHDFVIFLLQSVTCPSLVGEGCGLHCVYPEAYDSQAGGHALIHLIMCYIAMRNV